MAKKNKTLAALVYLETLIEEYRNAGRKRLPTTRDLAAGAGVSEMTLRKALAILRKQGTVNVSHGTGTTIRQDDAPREQSKTSQARWMDLRDKLYNDITSGTLYTQIQPKELRVRYGVAHTTLSKALNALVREGTLEPFQRGYRLPGKSNTAKSSIAVVLRGIDYGDIVSLSDLQSHHVRFIQNISRQSDINVVIVPIRYSGTKLVGFNDIKNVVNSTPSVKGILILSRGINTNFIENVCRLAIPKGIGIGLLSDDPKRKLRQQFGKKELRIEHPSCSDYPGELMADYLLQRGHRNALYLCNHMDVLWSRLRYQGIKHRFSRLHGNVEWCTVTASHQKYDAKSGVHSILPHRIKHHVPGHLSRSSLITMAYSSLEAFVKLAELQNSVDRVLKRAIDEYKPTVIVASSDDLATCVLNTFDLLGIIVPDEYSVVGFDNDISGISRGLTSFDFDIEGAITRLFHFLMLPAEARRSQPVTTGYVLDRVSCTTVSQS